MKYKGGGRGGGEGGGGGEIREDGEESLFSNLLRCKGFLEVL